jgi:hypothetical protein
MAGFLYYLPHDGPKTQAELEAAGFPHAEIIELPGGGVTGGPDGLNGHVSKLRGPVVAGGHEPTIGYYAETQVWREILDGKMWLGWERDNPPTPLDLQRPKLREGHTVTLADGNEWIVPVIRTLVGEAALSPVLTCDRSGKVLRERVEPEFARIWDLTQRAFAALQTVPYEASKISDDEVVELYCSALAMNYRMSRWEVLYLGLLSAKNMEPLFAALIDYPPAMLVNEEEV